MSVNDMQQIPRALTLSMVWIALLSLPGVSVALAGACSVVEPASLRANTDSDLVLCGDELPPNIKLVGLEKAGVQQLYLAPLKECNWNDQRAGFHLVLKAPAKARGSKIYVADAATDKVVCELTTEVLPARPAPDRSWEGSMPEASVKVIDVKGIKTRYFERGNGPPLVLVHGGQSGGYNNHARKWEAAFPGLARTFRVIALDRLGQGGTDALPPEDYPNYYALDPVHLEHFIEAVGLKDVTLVGHSQGGWPVMRVALDRPDLVRCLVNVGTVLVPDDGRLMKEAMAFTRYIDLAGPVHPETGPTFYSARRGLELRMVSGNNITDANVRRVLEQYQSRQHETVRKIQAQMRLNPAHPSFIALKKQAYADIAAGQLKVRSLSIWGDHDLESPHGLGQPFHQMLLDGGVDDKLVFVEGSGHSPHTEFPDAFNRIVVDYCGPGPH